MTHHGSWYPSQAAHWAESFVLIWFPSWLLAMLALDMMAGPAAWAGGWVGFAAACLAEGKSIGNRMRVRDVGFLHAVNRGDVLDFGVHNLGWMTGVAIVELVPVFWRWLF